MREGLRLERTKASPRFSDGTFKNTNAVWSKPTDSPPASIIAEFLFKRGRREPKAPLPVDRPHAFWAQRPDTGFRATWLGHSTVLLEMDGKRILTDPVFGERVSPVSFAGPKRFHPVPATIDELPDLDVVVLSHDHFDHLCKSTMTALAKRRVPIVTALGVGKHLESYGVDPSVITELDWGEHAMVSGVRLSATPAQHFSGRGPFMRNATLWASWVIQTERRKVFFSGDTGLTPEFRDIGALHGPFDLVMLEVGAFHPSWAAIHLGPENALTAFEMLGGGTLLPVHWGTFNLALHDWDEPAETLVRAARERKARIVTPRLGSPFEPEQIDGATPWWRGVVEPGQLPLESSTLTG